MKIHVKKWDVIIICILLVISFVPYGLIKAFLGQQTDYVYAEITVEGEFYKKVPLTGQMDRKEIKIETEQGYNVVIVQNESISIEDADCSDHVCEYFGWKNTPGDIIVCMPHSVCIEIKGTQSEDEHSKDSMDARMY